MLNDDQKNRQPMICNFIPGYVNYQDIGFRLAEIFVDLIEWLFGWRR